MHSRNTVILGIVCAMVAAIGFSVKSILIKLAFAHGVDSVTLLALRMGFALPFFIGMALWGIWRNRQQVSEHTRLADGSIQSAHKTELYKLSRVDWQMIVALSTCYYLFNYLDFLGLQTISAGLERMIQFLYPTMTVLLSAWLYKQALSKATIWALVLSYAGIILVFMHDIALSNGSIALGAGLVFASALFYAIYLVGAGHVVNRIGATRFTAYAMILASLASLLQFGLSHPLAALQQPAVVYELALAMALFSTVLPVFTLVMAMRLIGAGSSSLIGSVGPIVTLYLAHLFLGEPLSGMQLLGSLLVLAGVVLIGRYSRQREKLASGLG